MAESDVNDVHEVMHDRINAVFTNEAIPLADRVRMAGAVGLVMGVLGFAAGKAFLNVRPTNCGPRSSTPSTTSCGYTDPHPGAPARERAPRPVMEPPDPVPG